MTKQDFIDNMAEIMNQMKWLCSQNNDDFPCNECPMYNEYCKFLESGINTPDTWEDR